MEQGSCFSDLPAGDRQFPISGSSRCLSSPCQLVIVGGIEFVSRDAELLLVPCSAEASMSDRRADVVLSVVGCPPDHGLGVGHPADPLRQPQTGRRRQTDALRLCGPISRSIPARAGRST